MNNTNHEDLANTESSPIEQLDDSTVREYATVNNNSNNHYSPQTSPQAAQQQQQHLPQSSPQQSPQISSPHNPMSRAIMLEGDFEFLRYLSVEELRSRMSNLDIEMEGEIEELRRRYAAKRQPILDAMDSKKKRQQNF